MAKLVSKRKGNYLFKDSERKDQSLPQGPTVSIQTELSEEMPLYKSDNFLD